MALLTKARWSFFFLFTLKTICLFLFWENAAVFSLETINKEVFVFCLFFQCFLFLLFVGTRNKKRKLKKLVFFETLIWVHLICFNNRFVQKRSSISTNPKSCNRKKLMLSQRSIIASLFFIKIFQFIQKQKTYFENSSTMIIVFCAKLCLLKNTAVFDKTSEKSVKKLFLVCLLTSMVSCSFFHWQFFSELKVPPQKKRYPTTANLHFEITLKILTKFTWDLFAKFSHKSFP